MKKMYWHAHNLPRIIMLSFCIFVLAGLFIVEYFKQDQPQPNYHSKLQAASIAYKAFGVVKDYRNHLGIAIDTKIDPLGSGLIGNQLTSITTDSGDLYAKQTTINPNVAALIVAWLKELNVHEGDYVAVGMTGSFPALDISTLSAIKALGLKPIIVLSAAASEHGANIPGLTFIDMYHSLTEAKVFDYPIAGVSLGGKRDKAYGMDEKGRKILIDTINKYHYHYLDSQKTLDGINKRMGLYTQDSKGKDIAAYINVGGGMASIGLKRTGAAVKSHSKLHSLPSGVINTLPVQFANTDSVAVRFLKDGTPVINMHNIENLLINKYKFPASPHYEPLIGEGVLFDRPEYNTWLAMLFLGLDILVFIGIAVLSKRYMIQYKPQAK